jgi:UDP:flavonoid glycosyltransferase YjiC (YdhE family)
MLVVPHAHDQPDNARRVQRLGVSRTLRAEQYRRARVIPELRALLAERSYAARAHEVAALVRSEGGADAAAAQVASLLARR